MKKKILAVILTLVMALTVIPVVAFADDDPTVNVTFDPNYAGGETTTKEQVVGGTYQLPNPAPTRANYDFVGWFTEAQGGTQVTSATPVEATTDHTIYAHWAEIYTVTFDTNGGTPATIDPQTVAYGGKITKPVEPTKEGYKFIGWIQGDGSLCWDFDTDLVAGNMTLTASWKELEEFDVELSQTEFTYDGEAHVPKYVVKDQDGNTLTEGADYHVSIAGGEVAKQIEAGEVEMIFYSDKDGYKNTTVTYKIVDTPKTGDTTNMWLYIALAALALGAIGTGVVAVRRKANR